MMGEWKMEEMPLPALFEQARKIHATVTDSGAADQVCLFSFFIFFFNFLGVRWGGAW